MELGAKGEQNTDCIKDVVESIKQKKVDKLAYTTHGVLRVTTIGRYNGTTLGKAGKLFDTFIKDWHEKYDLWLDQLKTHYGLITQLLVRRYDFDYETLP